MPQIEVFMKIKIKPFKTSTQASTEAAMKTSLEVPKMAPIKSINQNIHKGL